MAQTSGQDEDSSISVLDGSSTEGASTTAVVGIPAFHMYSGENISTDTDASHYALNLSYQAIQKRNRDLELTVQRLQRENQKIRVIKRKSEDRDMNLSPNTSVYRSRGPNMDSVADSSTVPDNSDEFRALHEYNSIIEHKLKQTSSENGELRNKLKQMSSENRELRNKLEEQDERYKVLEQKKWDISQKLAQALDIAASRLSELDNLRNELDRQRQLNDQLRQTSSGPNSNLADLSVQVRNLKAENSAMTQLYEEAEAKSESWEMRCRQNQKQVESMQKRNQELMGEKERLVTMLQSSPRQHANGIDGDVEEDLGQNEMSLVSDARKEMAELRRQLSQMQEVIKTQTSLIARLGEKLRTRSTDELTGPPQRPPSIGGARPRSGPPLSPQAPPSLYDNNQSQRTSPGRDTSLGDEEYHTLTDIRPPSPEPSRVGVISNGVNIQAQPIVQPRRSNHTEPIIRHPPTVVNLPPERRSYTEPLVTRERNSAPADTYQRTDRRPIEQSDNAVSSKICPVCDKVFINIAQDSFEYHVDCCLAKAESAPPVRSEPTPVAPVITATPDEIHECPVCNQVFPPTGTDQEFQQHVNGHFADEHFETLGK